MKLTLHLDINANLPDTYQTFTDIQGSQDTIAGIEKIETVDPTGNLVGTRWRETRTEFGKTDTIEMWVTDAKANDFYTVESDAHGTHYTSTYRFESLGDDSTRVTFEFTGKPLTIGAKLATPLMMLFIGPTKKLFLKDMQDLKSKLEK